MAELQNDDLDLFAFLDYRQQDRTALTDGRFEPNRFHA